MPRFLLGLLVFVLASPAWGQLSPDKATETFKVAAGLEWTLWASEPLCVNPTCMDIDHKGRVWYCESINYRQKLRGQKVMRQPEGDRIVVLEDTKGTGKADKATVFYQAPEVHAPLGIAIYPYPDGVGCKVYVCQSPDILVFEDKNGDLKADGPPTKLLTGFRGLDHDHGVHGILIGPDNRLYFTVGDSGVQNLQASDGKGPKWTSNSTDCRAATVWRCDLDGKNLELIAHNFRNNYEPCVDSFGTVMLSDNDDDGNQQTRICYVMPGGNYGYHHTPKTSHWNEEHPGIVPKILRTYFGSPTGICFYEGTLLPKQYQGQLLHTDAGPRHVRCYHLTPQGAGYKAEQENVIESSDTWFRPSDVCVAPDGSVFVCDWYDPGVGGHGIGDFTRGRIYRLAPAGHKPSVPALDLQSPSGLQKALASPNLAVRAAAMGKIQQLGLPQALKVVEPAALNKEDAVLRARALWRLAQLGNLRHVVAAFEDPDPRFRILAMRILQDVQRQNPSDYLPDWQKRLLKDPSPAVKREALLLLRNAEPAKAAPLILQLAQGYDGHDRFYLAAVGIAVGHHDKERRDVILKDLDKHFPTWDEKVAGLLWELRPPALVGMLEKKLMDAKLPEHQKLQVIDILSGSSETNAGLALVQALAKEPSAEVREALLKSLKDNLAGKWSNVAKSSELGEVIGSLLKSPGKEAAGLALAAAARRGELLKTIIDFALNLNDMSDKRKAAIRALGAFSDAQATQVLGLLFQQVKQPLPETWKAEVVAALGKQGTKAAQDLLANLAAQPLEVSLPLRQSAVAALAGSKEGSAWLLQAYAAKKLSADLTSDLSRLLRNSPYGDIKKQAQAALPAPPKLDPKQLPSIPALLARKGNVERGKSLMALTLKNDVACLKCHTINKVGGQVGPDLSVIGSKASKENLLESILYPSRAVADQFVQWIVETNGGQVINGLIVEETPAYLVLRDVNAKDHKVSKKDVASKTKSASSLMPDNLLAFMSEDDLLDLVEYLFSLKSPPLAPVSRRVFLEEMRYAGPAPRYNKEDCSKVSLLMSGPWKSW